MGPGRRHRGSRIAWPLPAPSSSWPSTPRCASTHFEFVRLRDRLRRLSLYTTTNAQIPTFTELGTLQRAAVVLRMLR